MVSLPIAGVSRSRPLKFFVQLSDRSKRRRTEDLRSKDVEELAYATQIKLRVTGNVDASKIFKNRIKSPQRAKKYVTAINTSTENQPCLQKQDLRKPSMRLLEKLTKTSSLAILYYKGLKKNATQKYIS